MSLIRVLKVETLAEGTIRVAIRGGHVDAVYVSGILKCQKGVTVSEPIEEAGTASFMIYVDAKGTPANPLTDTMVIRWLESDQEIDLEAIRRHEVSASDSPVICGEPCGANSRCSGSCQRPTEHRGDHFCNTCHASW